MSDNEIVDVLGRKIKLKEITGRSRLSLYRALGAKDAVNGAVLSEYWNIMAIDEIEGRKQPSIKAIVDVDYLYGEMEKGDFSEKITKWIELKEQEKKELEEMEKEEKTSIKK